MSTPCILPPQPEWVVSPRCIQSEGMVIQHHIQNPAEVSLTYRAHHVLLLNLGHHNHRQITRFGQQEYDGPNPAGAFWLAPAGDTPAFWAWDSVDEAMMFVIDPLHLQQVAREVGIAAPERLELKNLTFGQDPQFVALAQQYYAELYSENALGEALYRNSLGNLLLLHLLRHYHHQCPTLSLSKAGLGDRRLKKVLAYIDAHLGEALSLKELAEVAGLGQCYFSSMFKKSLGIPPYRYILLRRIERAKQVLQQDDLSLSEIALHCGFADQSHFTRLFHKWVGMTPRAFREH